MTESESEDEDEVMYCMSEDGVRGQAVPVVYPPGYTTCRTPLVRLSAAARCRPEAKKEPSRHGRAPHGLTSSAYGLVGSAMLRPRLRLGLNMS